MKLLLGASLLALDKTIYWGLGSYIGYQFNYLESSTRYLLGLNALKVCKSWPLLVNVCQRRCLSSLSLDRVDHTEWASPREMFILSWRAKVFKKRNVSLAKRGGNSTIGKRVARVGESTFLSSQLFASRVNGSLSFERKCRKVSSPW